jgi:CRP-like cAMP-binding protein
MVNRFMTSGNPAPRGDVRAELRLLREVPTLKDAPDALLRRLVREGHVVHAHERRSLMVEQTAAEKAYVLLDGVVDAYRRREELGRCRPGELLGEIGIVRRRLRSATLVSASDLTLLHLDRPTFEALYDEESYFRDLVGEAVTRKSA